MKTSTTHSASRSSTLVMLCVAMSLVSPAASAQDADLAATLMAGVPCAAPQAHDRLANKLELVDAGRDELLTALNRLGSDTDICAPLREAAADLAMELAASATGAASSVTAAARERMEGALREADRRAASLSFEVGPPPRNLTRGNGSFPQS